MRKVFHQHETATYDKVIFMGNQTRKKYGFFRFGFDVVMTLVTSGLWLIWIFVREMRGR